LLLSIELVRFDMIRSQIITTYGIQPENIGNFQRGGNHA
jgi:hypothetical protein